MPHDETTTYLAIAVGRYRLALAGERVVTILGDVPADGTVPARGDSVRILDLHALFGCGKRALVPFAVVFEATNGHGAIGVDRVDHLRLATRSPLVPVPKIGLTRPALFAGALRDQRGLLLVIDPEALSKLVAAQESAI